ncbi:MAG: hypothetical protein KJ007_08385 [Burkholderiales bacterium]|nr:hypothetical protein [Burkholderiales bacterium]
MATRRTPLSPPPYATDRETLEREVVVDVFRASGPGGQHVNRTESALRLFHPPSGFFLAAPQPRHRLRKAYRAPRAAEPRAQEARGDEAHARLQGAAHRREEAARPHQARARQGGRR